MAGTTPETSSHEHFQHAPDQSALERELNKGLSRIEPYSNQILIGFIVAAVVLVGVIFWLRSSGTQQSAAWSAFAESRAPEDFLAVADKYPDAAVGEWARLQAAKLFASEGLAQALTNRAASDASLKKAKESYDVLLKKKSAPAELRQEALYGLATCLEAMSDGDTQPAIDAYEALQKEFPDNPHRLWAQSRITDLKTQGAESFYAWFRKQDPKPADRPGPRDIPALDSLKSDLNLELPGEPGAPANPGEGAPELPEGAAMPEKGASPAAEFPPGAPAETPAAETPKPVEKPAGETPAADAPATEPAAPKLETPAKETPAPASPEAATEPAPAEEAAK